MKFLRYVDHIDTYADTTLGFKKRLLAVFSVFFAHSNNINRQRRGQCVTLANQMKLVDLILGLPVLTVLLQYL